MTPGSPSEVRSRGLLTVGQSSTMWTISSLLELGDLTSGTNIPWLLKLAGEEVSINMAVQDLISSCGAEPEIVGQTDSVMEAGESHVSWQVNLGTFVSFALVLLGRIFHACSNSTSESCLCCVPLKSPTQSTQNTNHAKTSSVHIVLSPR